MSITRVEDPSQVAGPSRMHTEKDSLVLSAKQRERQLSTNKTLGRKLRTTNPDFFDENSNPELDLLGRDSSIILNSPVTTSPSSFCWDIQNGSGASQTSDSRIHFPTASESASGSLRSEASDCPTSLPANADAYVAPLSLKRRPRRKSLSLAAIEMGMTTAQRDTVFAQEEPKQMQHSQDQSRQVAGVNAGASSLGRSQSLNPTQSPMRGGASRRYPRPLPPLPLSRPASPALSVGSASSHGSPRPLPTPPGQVSSPDVSHALESPRHASESPSPRRSIDARTPPLTLSPLAVAQAVPPSESESASPSTASPSTPNSAGGAFRPFSLSPRKIRGKKKYHQPHASPYKYAHGPTRYSTTSLSSQVSVPPVPPLAEIRRRNRGKMAKLIRVLGESPPSHMVFGGEHGPSAEPIVEEAEDRRPGSSSSGPSRERSASVPVGDEGEGRDVIRKVKKSLSDPEAGHGLRPHSPTPLSLTPSRLFLRAKKGRENAERAARYVVSLSGDASSPVPKRMAFKLTPDPNSKPPVSYFRGKKPSEMKAAKKPQERPPLRLSTLDLPPNAQQWVREVGGNHWEVDNYDNVVDSLRRL